MTAVLQLPAWAAVGRDLLALKKLRFEEGGYFGCLLVVHVHAAKAHCRLMGHDPFTSLKGHYDALWVRKFG